jgi:diadenosine tetraphosphatase ApaH/serine/threonine PP2A family protein phosphatase
VKVAALYDIHGNLPALEAVLAEVPGDAEIVFGGDVFAGPMPAETLARVRGLGSRAHFLVGNADREEAPPEEPGLARYHWVQAHLSAGDRNWVDSWPRTLTLDVDGLGLTLFCHGSPRSDVESITAVTSEDRLRELLQGVNEPTVVCGHTHHQFDRRLDDLRVVNAGSVGLAYEGQRGAYWALLGLDVELRRSEYDAEAAAATVRASTYPDPEEKIEVWLDPPSAEEAAEVFEQQALAETR